MRIRLFLALSLVAALPASAQTPAGVPIPATFQTDAARVLTPEFVRDADFIGVGHLSRDERQPELARLTRSDFEEVRGWEFMGARGLVLPSSMQGDAPLSRDLCIVVGRFDPIRQQVVLLARLDATPENVAKIKELEAANRRLKFTVSSDKTEYGVGEPIALTWEVQNVSSIPQKIYTGPFSRQFSLHYGNTDHSNGTGGSHVRKREDYVELAPSAKWSQSQSMKGPFPQGEVNVDMTLDSSDNFLGQDLDGAKLEERAKRERVEGVVFVRETQTLSVQIKAPTKGAQEALIAKLASPNWNEALAAAQTLSQLDDSANRPEVKRMSRHSWPAIRILAAQALSKNATSLTPELRALLFDTDPYVRSETLDMLRRRRVEGAGLSVLALAAVQDEAVQKGVLSDKQFRPDVGVFISHTRESSRDLGDLLAARIKGGKANSDGINAPYLLNFVAENFHVTQLRSDIQATPEQTTAILAAWKTASPDVKPANLKARTVADLNAEIQSARALMFDDFALGPHYPEVVAHLQNIGMKFFPGPDNADRRWFEALDAPSRIDVLHAMEWRSGGTESELNDAPAWRAVASIEGPAKNEAFRLLLSKMYNAQNGVYQAQATSFFAPISLAKLDFARARPHLEIMLQAKSPDQQLGAAIGLLVGGERSAVPLVFDPTRSESLYWLDSEEMQAALTKVTGQGWKNISEWQKWWQDTGQKMDWK